jgi:ParB family transcriptional regulator, chromosome partitioning protein
MNERPPQRRGLGRGLGSLIPTAPHAHPAPEAASVTTAEPSRDGHQPSGTPADWIGRIPEPGETPTVAEEQEPADDAAGPDSSAERDDSPTGFGSDGAHDAHGANGAAGEANVERDIEGLRPVDGAYFAEIDVAAITPNPRQPRQIFDEEAMAELVHSVREVGLLQPVVVRPTGDASYELIMGERRWRAVQEAGLPTVPAIVRETGDDVMLRDALLENLHRAQLNPLEEAAAYRQLLDDFGCTHEELAARIGRSRPQISNTLRLLNLSPPVQRRVAAGILSAGHARTLLGVEDEAAQDRLAGRVVAEGISVRGLEELVAVGDLGEEKVATPRRAKSTAPAVVDLADRLSDLYDTRVKVDLGRTKGRITIEFASLPDLERIVATMDPTYTRRHVEE